MVLMGKGPNEKYHCSYEAIAQIIDLFCAKNATDSKR